MGDGQRVYGILLAAISALTLVACSGDSSSDDGAEFTSTFAAAKDDLVTIGRNPYLILEPGHTLVLEGDGEKLTITVLNETKVVDGVETRVVEERETKDGKIAEITRNYLAISKRTNDVFYFGEDADFYKDGKVDNHHGSWLSGVNGAKFGLLMPGQPMVDSKYYQEIAPKVAEDRAKIVSLNKTVKTPAGEFAEVLQVEETNPLEKKAGRELKYYAKGIGLVLDGELKLVKVETAAAPRN